MSTTMDYEAWRCTHDASKFCPEEGCPKAYGCARDHGWKPGDPTPEGCLPQGRRHAPTEEYPIKAGERAYRNIGAYIDGESG